MSELNSDALKAAREAFGEDKYFNHCEEAITAYLAALPKQEPSGEVSAIAGLDKVETRALELCRQEAHATRPSGTLRHETGTCAYSLARAFNETKRELLGPATLQVTS